MDAAPDAANPLDRAQTPKERGAALLRFGAFLAIALILGVGLVLGLKGLLGSRFNLDQSPGPAVLTLLELTLALATVAVPGAILKAFTHEPLTRFGLGGRGRLAQLGIGVATGLAGMGLLIALMALCGGVHGWTLAARPGSAMLYGLGYAASFACVAVAEEGLLRGYPLIQLSRAVSFWPAAVATSLIFLLLHTVHATENPVGLAQNGVIGLVLAYSVRRTGAIWFALGCHAAWDFAETYLFGVPDSGVTAPGALSTVDLAGPVWLTGGVTGPEASWLVFPVLAGMAVVTWRALPRWR